MPKVKKMEKIEGHIYIERAQEDLPFSKNAWLCLTCGRVWLMRSTANNCPHKDFVFYGKRKFECIRKENPLQYTRSTDTYRAVQWESFEKLGTKPEDWVWTGEMHDLGPIGKQLTSGGPTSLSSCDLCGYAPLRYVFEIETVEWLVDLDARAKLQKMVDFSEYLAFINEISSPLSGGGVSIDRQKAKEQKGLGTVFRFDGRHKLGIGSECITNYMLATPALREQFDAVKKKIDKSRRTAQAKKKAEDFAEKYPDVGEMLDELRWADEILNMKFQEKWDYRQRDYLPVANGLNKTTSLVYRVEKSLRARGFLSPKLLQAFEDAWLHRDDLKTEAKKVEAERVAQQGRREADLTARAEANNPIFATVKALWDKIGGNPDLVRTHEESFVEDMYYRLRNQPDYEVSYKQKNWLRTIEEKVLGKKLEGKDQSTYGKLMSKLADLGVKPTDWENEFLKTVAQFTQKGRDLTPKMHDIWTRMFKRVNVPSISPKEAIE